MKKSKAIHIPLVVGLAATLGACNDQPQYVAQNCIDKVSNRVVAESFCTQPAGYVGVYPYSWYYGGSSYYGPGHILVMGGGGYYPRTGYVYRSPSGYVNSGGRSYSPGTYTSGVRAPTTRGGFGGTGAARGGFGGGYGG